VTMLQRRPTPRFTRAHYEKLLARVYEQRDRAEGARRADRDRVAAMLEGAAARYDADAAHLERLNGKSPLTAAQRRAIADELRDVLRDIEAP
jgi:hypothetical protein